MNFCLIRHADAEPVDPASGLGDEDRPLTDKGLQQCHDLAAALQRAGVELGKVVTSPYLRAKQTAEEMLKHWEGTPPELVVCEALAPGGKDKKLSRFLRGLESETVTLVGHMPELAVYAAWLVGSKKTQLTLAKAGAAFIEADTGPNKGAGILRWLITPAWCAPLAEGSARGGHKKAGAG
jgi:phosphohistidine phosphatase